MAGAYYDFLNTLSKEDLVQMIYQPFQPSVRCTAISKRRIAIRLSYDGKNYHGVQCHDSILSIKECLENALELTNLGNNVVFCGRTDAGVSAINMVVTLDANSRLEEPNRNFTVIDSDFDEFPYDIILNKVLPTDIRVTGWAPAADGFSARYDCIQRHYKYFFTLGNMNLDLMKEAASVILKLDDFYCLSTHSNPKAVYKRKLDELFISKVNGTEDLLQESNENVKIENFKENLDSIADSMSKITNNEISSFTKNKMQCELQKARTKSLRMQHNQRIRPTRVIQNDLYCLDIKAGGFLHNMVRKIFWAIRNCGKGNKLVLDKVEIAEPEPLVFVGGRFNPKLNFIGNRYSERQFKEESDKSRISTVISNLRYQIFDFQE